MIRRANFADIPRLVEILADAHRRSVFAGMDGEVDVAEAKRLLVHAVQRHGHTKAGGTFVMVAEAGGAVEGMIVGLLDRVYSIGTKLYATDLFFVATERVDPRDPIRLVGALIDWAKSAPECRLIMMAVTDTVSADPERTGKILARKGLRRSGAVFSMEVGT